MNAQPSIPAEHEPITNDADDHNAAFSFVKARAARHAWWQHALRRWHNDNIARRSHAEFQTLPRHVLRDIGIERCNGSPIAQDNTSSD
ncbi:hypothetical protein ACKTEK_03350 [Tepidamorphus sp. 3E244]|uniref:hypothetical protein n=1 Tax=Tepidamorphus sp. 3E244 TaxID=3385498 RepID=UPI0038FC03A9